ncbi:MAG: ABC transporter permease [Pseudomonadota bacterium]|nr:ABC transporter permease [Pseudomonadota bacterium]
MTDSLYIAWKYLSFSKARTLTLVACVTLIAVLPLSLELLLSESERQLASRAESTPLLVGTKGSALDLVMSSLYFSDEVPELISMAEAEAVMDSGLALPVPLYIRFRARGYPIVGTSLDYFEFRGLRIAEGRNLAMLGECVLGAAVAEELGLAPGDSLLSSPETLFDLAGIYPLKMRIVGVLERSHTSDDRAVFVDVKTAWVIQGLVHGHQDVTAVTDPTLVMDRSGGNVTATAKLVRYSEVTEDNLDSFHFHGDPAEYPLTAVIALPFDKKSSALLRGRYIGDEMTEQIVRPKEVIDSLLANIFRIKNLLDSVILVVAAATLMALALVFALSLRLRQREIETIFRLGCSRATIARLLGAEIVLILAMAGVLCAGLLMLLAHFDETLVRNLIA